MQIALFIGALLSIIGALISLIHLNKSSLKVLKYQRELFLLKEQYNQTLMESKLQIQEQTLNHISKEIHANISHLVSLININLSEIYHLTPHSQLKESIAETKSLAKQLLSELKALSASLNTDHIQHIGFTKALENELDRLTKKFKIVFNQTGEEQRFNPEHELILLRLCQEIINNTVQYARATLIEVHVRYSHAYLDLEISDNGIGFDKDTALAESAEKGSTGLINITRRARVIHADLVIKSQPGSGTKFILKIPIQ